MYLVMMEPINQEAFETLHNVIQSLRDQDNRLVEWIDELNKNSVKGKCRKYTKSGWNPIKLILPKSIDLKSFEENLYLKIADVNRNPTTFSPVKIYG